MKNGFKFGHMKNGMDSPVRCRKFEVDCHWTKNLSDSERAGPMNLGVNLLDTEWSGISLLESHTF